MSSPIRREAVYCLLMERFGWTFSQVEEMPDETLRWAFGLIVDPR
jgi:hypothetical protein